MRARGTVFCALMLLLVGCSPQSEPPDASETEIQASPTELEIEPQPAATETQSLPAATETQPPSDDPSADPTPTYDDAVYGSTGHFRQTVDVFLPSEGEGPFPTILAFHGGGFVARNKNHFSPYARHFTDLGYALVPANYRFVATDVYPAQVEDAFCALAWIHANASDLGIDTDRIFVMGDSAGGYLAAMLGTVDTPGLYQGDCPHEIPTSGPPIGAVILYSFFDFTNLDAHQESDIRRSLEPMMGGSIDEVPREKLEQMSPISWIDGGEPPFLVIHGTEDSDIKSWASEDFTEALQLAGVDATLFLLDAGHGFLLDPSSDIVLASLEVIDQFIGDLVDS